MVNDVITVCQISVKLPKMYQKLPPAILVCYRKISNYFIYQLKAFINHNFRVKYHVHMMSNKKEGKKESQVIMKFAQNM